MFILLTIYNKQGEINMSEPPYTQKIFFDPDNYLEGTLKAFAAFCQVFQLIYETQYTDSPKVNHLIHLQQMKYLICGQIWYSSIQFDRDGALKIE